MSSRTPLDRRSAKPAALSGAFRRLRGSRRRPDLQVEPAGAPAQSTKSLETATGLALRLSSADAGAVSGAPLGHVALVQSMPAAERLQNAREDSANASHRRLCWRRPLRACATLALAVLSQPMLVTLARSEPASSVARIRSATGTAPGTASVPDSAAIQSRPPRCASHFRLVACVMNARRPERSKAAIRNLHGVRVLGPGQRFDGLVLLAVEPTHAVLQTASGQVCYLPVFLSLAERNRVPAGSAAISERDRIGGVPTKEELQRGIRPAGPDRYLVARSLLERLVARPRALAKNTRLKALAREGRAVGLQLAKLRAESPLALLGLKQGDILLRINREPLANASGALATLTALRGATQVTLSIMRDNRPHNLTLVLD